MPRVFWNPYFQKGAGLARHAEPQAGNFQPIELMKSNSGDQTLCRQPCARTLCRQPCAGEPCAGLPCANPAGRGTRWHKVGLFRGQPYIYIYIIHIRGRHLRYSFSLGVGEVVLIWPGAPVIFMTLMTLMIPTFLSNQTCVAKNNQKKRNSHEYHVFGLFLMVLGGFRGARGLLHT